MRKSNVVEPSGALATRLREGATAYGSFVELPCAEAVEITAIAGWDFCVVDSEHGPISSSSYPAMVRAGQCHGMAVIVRVAENRPGLIQQALDAGADGVLVPQVASYEAAAAAVRAARFHPTGLRGLNGFVRAAQYSAIPGEEYVSNANAATVCALQLESAAACRDAGRIARIPGVDVLFLGPYDLSQSLGVSGETSHPLVVAEIENVIEICRKSGVAAGIYTNRPEDARDWVDRGIRFLACQVDTVVLLGGLQQLRASIQGAGQR